MQERGNLARGEASASEAQAVAAAKAVRVLASALRAEGGLDASTPARRCDASSTPDLNNRFLCTASLLVGGSLGDVMLMVVYSCIDAYLWGTGNSMKYSNSWLSQIW